VYRGELRSEQHQILSGLRTQFVGGKVSPGEYADKMREFLKGTRAEQAATPSIVGKHIATDDVDSVMFRLANSELSQFDNLHAQAGFFDWVNGVRPRPHELDALEKVFPGAKDAAEEGAKGWAFFKDAINAPRAVMASMDMSAILRQNVVFSFSRPITSMKGVWSGMKAAPSEKAYEILESGLAKHPSRGLADQAGLDITGLGTDLNKREEQFMSSIAEKIPVIGRGVRASNRFHVGFLNKVRMDVFADMAAGLEKAGYDPKKNPEVFEGAARYINVMTGRGPLKHLGVDFKGAAPYLNAVLFSPRFTASRKEMLNPLFYKNLPAPVRKQAGKDMAIAVGAVSSMVSLAALHPDVEVETDYRSADFLKARIGKTRVDMGAGITQWVRLYSQLGEATLNAATAETGERVAEFRGTREKLSGQRVKEPPLDILGRFLAGKEAPGARYIHRALGGKEPLPEGVAGMAPLAVQDFIQGLTEHGLLGGAAVGAGAFFGVGMQQYPERAAPEIRERFQAGQPLWEQAREMKKERKLPDVRTLDEKSKKYLEGGRHALQGERLRAEIMRLFMAGDFETAEALAREAKRKRKGGRSFRVDPEKLLLRVLLDQSERRQ
jgi:hypothetical protein